MQKVLIPILAAASALASFVPTWAWAQEPSDPERYFYGPGMMGWGGGWYGMIIGPLMMILVLAAVIATVVFLVRQTTTPSYHPSSGRTPLDILKERFARGEIDKNELEERRRVLGE